MTIHYKDVVPWGRNFDEYVRMFALSEADLQSRILGCGDGPASFNVECNQHGGSVTSIDPLYRFSYAEIEKRIAETFDDVIKQTRAHQENFVWDAISSPDELGEIRMQAMRRFLDSFEAGLLSKRYIPGELPDLPFADQTFDIALSSHFLFLYTDNLSFDFHVKSIYEMLRVAREARIFPLLDVNARESSYLSGILDEFQKYKPKVCRVNYEFQRNGNQMLVLQND
ncbi:MAG: SAM-dependent methyltransferase [Anaerolineales bacterium]|nr:SAM-dependent methyltransferase [Anaerolineales bacterium]